MRDPSTTAGGGAAMSSENGRHFKDIGSCPSEFAAGWKLVKFTKLMSTGGSTSTVGDSARRSWGVASMLVWNKGGFM